MQKINKKHINKIVREALNEDLRPNGDITTKLVNNKKSKAKIIANQNGIVAGLEFCKTAFKLIGKETNFLKKVKDGKKIKKGDLVASISANTKTLFS